LRRGLAVLAIPMILEMSMESIFSIVDVFFVAQLGAEAVAAVGLTEAILTLVYALSFGLGFPVTALIARRVGARERARAAEAAVQANWIGIALSAAVGLPGAWFAPVLLEAMGASEAVRAVGGGYASLLLASNAAIQLLFINGAAFRGAGDPTVAMKALVLANGANIALDPCLIFGWGPFPELGLYGAAVATTIGRGLGVGYLWVRLVRGSDHLRVEPRHLALRPTVIAQLLRLSVGGIGQSLVETMSWVLAVRIVVFAILPAWGLSNAAATLVGQNLGAGLPERAERAVWMSGRYTMFLLGFFLVAFVPFADFWVGLFTRDSAVLEIGAEGLLILSCGNLLYAWELVLVQSFNGAGDTQTPFRINLFCFWAVKLPLAYVLATGAGLGVSGVWYAVLLSYGLAAAIALAIFRRGAWKGREL
jgi:Na+-driven multidrug efflux pump